MSPCLAPLAGIRPSAACSARPVQRKVPSAPAELQLNAQWMVARDATGMPTGELVPPTPGPWDDCFTGLRSTPAICWPNSLDLTLSSSASYWVVYDQRPECICVEPQTSMPDFVNLAPASVLPGEPLEAWMEWRWSRAQS